MKGRDELSWAPLCVLTWCLFELRHPWFPSLHPAVPGLLAGGALVAHLCGSGAVARLALVASFVLTAVFLEHVLGLVPGLARAFDIGAAVVLEPLFEALGLDASAAGRSLHVFANGELRSFRFEGGTTFAREGLALWGAFWLHSSGRAAVRAALVLAVFLMLRTAIVILLLVGTDQGGDPSHMQVVGMWTPLPLGVGVWVWASVLDRWSPLELGSARGLSGSVRLSGIGLALTLGGLASIETGRSPATLRVLVDDRLSGVWEPAGRLLTIDRFGDFSTYSFATFVEFLSHRYDVVVNPDAAYTPELLADFDVWIVKTPMRGLEPEEIVALREWVEGGGGAFLISDHTDLGGMSTVLNELCAGYGITFQNDAVHPLVDAPFEVWRAPLVPSHAIAAGLGELELMTGCSIAVEFGAEEVLTLGRVARASGDYAGNSHFGSAPPQPDLPQGRACVAAAASPGIGRVVAFSDSTVFSSFAIHLGERQRFMARCIEWLGRDGGWPPLRVPVTLLAAGLLAVIRRARSGQAPGWPALAFLVAASVGLHVQGASLDRSVPAVEVPTLGISTADSMAALPPVLGGQDGTPVEANFATLSQLPLRLGLEVREPVDRVHDLPELNALMLLNPGDENADGMPPAGQIEALRRWIEAGGRLLVFRSLEHAACTHDEAPAWVEGCAPDGREVELGLPGVHVLAQGRGHVALIEASERFSVAGLGHCMGYPDREQRAHQAVLVALFEALGLRVPDAQRRTYFPTVQAYYDALARRLHDGHAPPKKRPPDPGG